MGQVVATAEHVVHAPADRVHAALADYSGTRQRIAGPQFSEYRVEVGGQGAGTRVHWTFAATEKRVRDQVVSVSELPDAGGLVESDTKSSMVTTWTLHPAGAATTVRVRTTWDGASGIGGFFERTFAPKGLRRTYDGMLQRLDDELQAAPR